MGYTNYWKQYQNVPDKAWKSIKKEYEEYIKPVAGNLIEDRSTENEIIFDGGCETFILSKIAKIKPDYKGQDPSFNFCKTRAAKYDLAVWYLLTFVNKVCPDIEISRDR